MESGLCLYYECFENPFSGLYDKLIHPKPNWVLALGSAEEPSLPESSAGASGTVKLPSAGQMYSRDLHSTPFQLIIIFHLTFTVNSGLFAVLCVSVTLEVPTDW